MRKTKTGIYTFYYLPTDSIAYETDNYDDAQEYARGFEYSLPGYAYNKNYSVGITTEDGDKVNKVVMTIDDFMEFPNPNPLPDKINFDVVLDDTPKPTKELEKEPFHNLDEKETREVLKYTDTGFILGELARRLEEYDAFTQTIKKALDHLDINA